jgi:hypothetical protein
MLKIEIEVKNHANTDVPWFSGCVVDTAPTLVPRGVFSIPMSTEEPKSMSSSLSSSSSSRRLQVRNRRNRNRNRNRNPSLIGLAVAFIPLWQQDCVFEDFDKAGLEILIDIIEVNRWTTKLVERIFLTCISQDLLTKVARSDTIMIIVHQ